MFLEMSVDFRKLHGVISQNIELFTNLPLFSIAYVPHIGVIWVYFPEHVVFKHFLPVSFFSESKRSPFASIQNKRPSCCFLRLSMHV